jgi:hypothetical protein
MNDDFYGVDERLTRLARATDDIGPRAGFESRVLLVVRQARLSDWRLGWWRVGRYGLAISALVLVLAAAFAARGEIDNDEQQAIAYGTVDFEW